MTLSPCLASTLTFRRRLPVTTTATAATAFAAASSYTDNFEEERNEMKENGIDASMIQSTLPNLTVDRIQTKTKQKHQRKPSTLRASSVYVCVCLLLVRAKAKIKRNKYGATRSAGDYRRKVQLARLCALGGKDMV